MNVPNFPAPYARYESHSIQDEIDEQELVESFRKMKIVDLPKFNPTNSSNSNRNHVQYHDFNHDVINDSHDTNKIFDIEGNFKDTFFSFGLNTNPNLENNVKKILNVVSFPSEKKNFFNEKFVEEEDDQDEDGQFNEKNDYPEEIEDDRYTNDLGYDNTVEFEEEEEMKDLEERLEEILNEEKKLNQVFQKNEISFRPKIMTVYDNEYDYHLHDDDCLE